MKFTVYVVSLVTDLQDVEGLSKQPTKCVRFNMMDAHSMVKPQGTGKLWPLPNCVTCRQMLHFVVAHTLYGNPRTNQKQEERPLQTQTHKQLTATLRIKKKCYTTAQLNCINHASHTNT